MKIPLILVLACISAYLYRKGGSSHGNTLFRDIGCGLVSLVACGLLGLTAGLKATAIAYFLSFGLSWGACSAYWAGGKSVKFKHWLLHGLGIALAILPIAFITGHWIGFSLRLVVLPLAIAVWSVLIGYDVLEEAGRGALIILTLLLA